ncbi:MAG: hypothetical protein IPL54_11420 [Chitinophagaceae bacterium]|nr:hypothetical protein [Chitinophagaceae bacterium]
MKKIKLLLLLLMLGTASAYSQLQQIKIVSFTVKNQLPAVIDNWGNTPGSLLLVAQLPPNVSVKGIRLMVQIKGGGAIICSNNSAGGMQVDEFTTRTFSANELTGTLQGCPSLKEGSYSICVQFFNVDRVAISNEVCKEFSVEAPRETEYNPPTLINPENGKVFTEAELSRPVTFRWTPLVPKPREPVTYRLKVWQLMQGQSSAEAMRSNQPIATKDADNITQTVVNGIYTGPCRPPYLCEFVWQVQALNREGKPMGKNEGKSEGYTFKVETNTSTATPPQLVAPVDAKTFAQNEMAAPVTFRWTPVVPKPQSVKYRLKVWQLMQGQTGAQAMRTNQPIVTKDVDNITQVVVNGIYTGPCRPPYLCDYVWQVQAVDREDKPVGNNEGKSELWSFKIGDAVTTCTAPKLSAPADTKSFAPKDMSAPVLFRWTPVVPKPQEPVTYRLRVWQLMQGQSGSQAMKTNPPIITRDVADITEASISGIYTGPCRPPYLCDYIWEVQALNREGKPICSNEGKSEAWSFKIQNNIDIQIDSLKVGCCEKGKQTIYIKVRNNLATPVNIIAIKYKVNGVGASITLSPTSPVIPQTIAGNTFKVFTASIECNPAINFLKFLVDAEDVADPDNKETEVKSDTLRCACTACDEKNFILNAPPPGNITISNNTITFNQPITVTTTPAKTIKSIKAELVYYEMVPENDMCIPCNKDAATYGHFTNGINSLDWNGPQQSLNINITTPQLTPCCSAVFKWCIRYKIEFKDCTTCNKLVCYEKKKEGCEKVNPDKNIK